jgi:hypothetical protein
MVTGMNELLQTLLKLQALDFAETTEKNTEKQKAELRSRIPAQILGHYDRLVVRGKKGVAIVRDQVCTGCHMRLPIGTITTLMHGNDIQLCDTCGRYLCLESVLAAALPPPAPAVKPMRKPRKKKTAKSGES